MLRVKFGGLTTKTVHFPSLMVGRGPQKALFSFAVQKELRFAL